MTWSSRFRIREEVRGSLWLVPLTGAILGGLLGSGVPELDRLLEVSSHWTYSPTTASTVLSAIVGATAALTGFVITVTVLVVQMATGTFSARYMRLWYRDRMLKATLAVLVGTLAFSFSLLRRVEQDFVPDLGVTVAGVLLVVSLLLFLLFFDRFIHRLRPVAVASLVAEAADRTFAESVRSMLAEGIRFQPSATRAEPSFVVRSSRPGAIQAIDLDGLVAWARTHESEVVVTRVVGDFVPTAAPLLEVRGRPHDEGAERHLRGFVALGDERTIQQDPAFAIRILVDIAIRALSPAVNDPTTAVQVLNHLGATLRHIGSTNLAPSGSRAEGPGVVLRMRRWEDFLALGVTEIREYGASSVQVMRRLRATLDELSETVRPEHRAAVLDELKRLDETVSEHWGRSVDLDRARIADRQGIGGPGADGPEGGS